MSIELLKQFIHRKNFQLYILWHLLLKNSEPNYFKQPAAKYMHKSSFNYNIWYTTNKNKNRERIIILVSNYSDLC